ncbi:MAG TPA: guanylate kinase [Candidatus Avilachnospira avistercoris]|nr:guanylate kinase [Candidatus Avilachnospira avistercoris]
MKSGKIYCIMGKSASGKDTVYRELRRLMPELKSYVMYSTRPMREGEQDGVTYHFVSEEELSELEQEGRVIEKRVYHTVLGPWYYATVDDGQLSGDEDILMLTTPEGYMGLRSWFGDDRLRDIYIEIPDGERLLRAVKREMQEREPHYAEVCRRFLSDCEDFSEEKLFEAGISHRYENLELEACVRAIAEDIKKAKDR